MFTLGFLPPLLENGAALFLGIFAEIERTPNVRHGSITDSSIAEQLAAIGEKKNVCFVTHFGNLERLEMAVREGDVL